MAFLNKLSKCVGTALKIDKKINIVFNQTKYCFAEESLSIFKKNKDDLANAGRRLYATQAAVNAEAATQAFVNEEVSTNINKSFTRRSMEKRIRSMNNLSSALVHADILVRKYGRLNAKDVEKMIELCKPEMPSTEAVMLIKCTGEVLRKEPLQKRQALFDKVLEKLAVCCPNKTIEMLNAEMSVKIENKVDFDPAKMLALFDQLKLIPSKHSMHLLLTQYCERKNIEKALEILEHMKNSDWSINPSTIHNILKAYVILGKKQECENLLAEMSQNGLRPTAETFTCLLEGYATNADVAAIKQVMIQASESKVQLNLRNLYEVLLKLVEAGHADRVPEVMDVLGLTDGLGRGERFLRENHYNNRIASHQRFVDFQDTSNTLFQLLANKNYNPALYVLKSFSDQLYDLQKDESNIVLKLFLSQLIRDSIPHEDLYNLRDQLVENNILMREWEPLAFYVIRDQNIDYILKFFEDLQSKPFELKLHYFWPLLKRSANNPKDMLKIIKEMLKKFSVQEITTSVYTWGFSSWLVRNNGDYNALLQLFKEAEVAKPLRDQLRFNYLLSEGQFGEATKCVDECVDFTVKLMKGEIAKGVEKGYSSEEFTKLMKSVVAKSEKPEIFSGIIFESCVYKLLNNSTKLQDFLKTWVDADLKVDEGVVRNVTKLLSTKKLPEDVLQNLSKVSVNYRNLTAFDSILTSDLRADGVELPQKETKKSRTTKNPDEQLPPDVQTAKTLLIQKKNKDFRTLVHSISEKPDVDTLKLMQKALNLPLSLKNFFNRKLFVAHLNCGRQKEILPQVTSPEISSYISAVVLSKIVEKDASLLDTIDEYVKNNTDKSSFNVHVAFYQYYINNSLFDKARDVLLNNPDLKKFIKLAPLCFRARFEKDEKKLEELLKLHWDEEFPRRVAVCHNSLIFLKCEKGDVKEVGEAYQKALDMGVPFEHLSIRSLQALQSLYLANKVPLPWKEGELEKRIEQSSSSSSSDSE